MEGIPFFATKTDDAERSREFINEIKGTLKKSNKLTNDNDDDDDDDKEADAALDEIIQSVFTDSQKATYKIYKESVSKKNRISRGDVRGLFVPMKKSPNMFEEQIGVFNCSDEKDPVIAYIPPPDYEERVDGHGNRDGHENRDGQNHTEVLLRNPNKSMNKRSSQRVNKSDLFNVFDSPPKDLTNSDGNLYHAKIHFIGKIDLQKLKIFAETEIRTIFRQNGDIKHVKLQTKRKAKDSGVYGVQLQTLLDRDCKKYPSLRVPLFVQMLINKLEKHLNEEGLLRVPGALARIKEVIQALETSDNYTAILQPLLPHDLGGLLKRFFRDLPSPILTLNWLDAFTKVSSSIKDERVKLHAFQTLLCLLPDVNRATLQMLFGLLVKICHNEMNRMTPQTVTLIISPSLFLMDSLPTSPLDDLDSMSAFSSVVMYFIKNYDLLWNIPSLFLQQMRQLNKKTAKRKNWMSGGKRSTTSNLKEAENSDDYILVHSLHADSPTMTIETTPSTNVAEVLQHFNKYHDPRFLESSCLFENGGNIEQQLLNVNDNISIVLQENRYARFSFARVSPDSLITHWPPKLVI